MSKYTQALVGLGLLVTGFIGGAVLSPQLPRLQAQVPAEGPTEETQVRIKAAIDAIDVAQQSLIQERLYNPAIEGLNAFAVTAGGTNALQDLETGRGVDPETFAGLYAGLAVDQVSQHLSRDDEGRLTYKNRVIRMAPISEIKRMYSNRSRLAGEEPEEGGIAN